MKKVISFILILAMAPSAYATVSTRVCLADGNTPLELVDPCVPFVYRPIMTGTHPTIIIDSNTGGSCFSELTTWDANQNYGCLYGRNYNEETGNWDGSILPAAGEMASVFETGGTETVDGVEHETKGFQFLGDAENSIPGDWFIIDYNAINTGYCLVTLVDDEHLSCQMSFTHVRTRDFDDDGIVNFKDFVLLGSNWRRTDCQTQGNCSGTDLDENGNVDFDDLKLFADFWLERTR